MVKRIFTICLSAFLLFILPVAEAAQYSAKDSQEIRRILRKAGVDTIQESLLIRRMEVRNVPASVAIGWSNKLSEMKSRKLPVKVAVDRLQQGLIKNIRINYLDKALNVLLNNLAWTNELIVEKAVGGKEELKELDTDEVDLLNSTTLNLEIAARQGYQRNELTVLMSRDGVDLPMAANLAEALTMWTNYGVESKRVLLSLKRSMRVGLSADKIKDVTEKVDSKVVADGLVKASDVARVIWREIRAEAEIMDAEHAYRTRMQRNPNSLSGSDGDSGSHDDLNISDVDVMGGGADSDSADMESGGAGADSGGGGMDAGGDVGGDIDTGGDVGDSDAGTETDGDSYDGGGMDGGMEGDH